MTAGNRQVAELIMLEPALPDLYATRQRCRQRIRRLARNFQLIGLWFQDEIKCVFFSSVSFFFFGVSFGIKRRQEPTKPIIHRYICRVSTHSLYRVVDSTTTELKGGRTNQQFLPQIIQEHVVINAIIRGRGSQARLVVSLNTTRPEGTRYETRKNCVAPRHFIYIMQLYYILIYILYSVIIIMMYFTMYLLCTKLCGSKSATRIFHGISIAYCTEEIPQWRTSWFKSRTWRMTATSTQRPPPDFGHCHELPSRTSLDQSDLVMFNPW